MLETMNSTITIDLPKKEKERLGRLALHYGLSLADFARQILQELTSEIETESFDDYENATALTDSFKRALRDWRTGRVHSRL